MLDNTDFFLISYTKKTLSFFSDIINGLVLLKIQRIAHELEYYTKLTGEDLIGATLYSGRETAVLSH